MSINVGDTVYYLSVDGDKSWYKTEAVVELINTDNDPDEYYMDDDYIALAGDVFETAEAAQTECNERNG